MREVDATMPSVLRTTVDDDLFIRMDRALGVPVVNQAVWRLHSLPSDAELDRLAQRLAVGRIGRLLRRSSLPLVRDHWVAEPSRSGGRVVDDTPVPEGGVTAWIDAAASTRFDLTEGPVWELRSAPLEQGGAVVTLCVAHAAGDGALIVRAVLDALSGDDVGLLDARPPSVLEQALDATGQAAAITTNLAALAADLVTRRVGRTPDHTTTATAVTAKTSRTVDVDPTASENDGALAPLCITSVPTEAWRAAAADAGGSSNALFVAIVIGIIVASGRVGPQDTVRISIPMSLRTPDDDRANATTGLSLDIPASAALEKDLGVIRALAKEVYAVGTGRPSTFVRLQPAMQALSDRTVAALSGGATTPLALASNLGTLDGQFAGLGDPDRANGVVTRSTTQAVTAEKLRSLRGGLAAWTNEACGITTLSVIGLDPDGLGRSTLPDIVHAEFARWSLEPEDW
ncbi:hypothetical protein [Williamsia sp. M5A3_1d]